MRRFVLLAVLLLAPIQAFAQTLTMFAAASLTDALRDVDKAWQAHGHPGIQFNFGASSTLARQIDQGARADLFASADLKWMKWAVGRKLIAADTDRTLLGNSLVLVEPKARMQPAAIGPGWNLMALLGKDGRLAVGDPAHVPVGIYARQALTKLGLWQQAEPRLARTADVRGALLLVERGEVPAGIVYSTDAAIASGVAIAGTFPADTHPPILYPFAVTRAGDSKAARAFLGFLAGPEARAIFVRRGFTIP